jgi:hypothetical protein
MMMNFIIFQLFVLFIIIPVVVVEVFCLTIVIVIQSCHLFYSGS